MECATPALRVDQARFSYGPRTIFDGVSFEVPTSQVFCLLGANGCGKTTLLRCVTGALKLDRGRILIGPDDLTTLNPTALARRLGVVYQDHVAPFAFSVLDVVRMGRAPHLGFFDNPSGRDTKMAEESIDRVGISHLRSRPYTAISGGERQLALIARALCQEPQIILLDEPTSHLDYANSIMVLRLLDDLASHGLTIVMTTHQPDHPLLMRSQVALIRDGSLLAIGAAEQVITTANLRRTYGIDVEVVTTHLPGADRDVMICVPVF